MDKNVLIWINVPIIYGSNSQSVNLWILRLYTRKSIAKSDAFFVEVTMHI